MYGDQLGVGGSVYTKAGSHTAHNYDRKQLRMLKQLMNMDQGLLETEF